MEWTIVTVIVVLIGLGVSICTPIIKLNTTIVKLMSSLDALSKTMESFDSKNTESHRRIWDHETKQDEVLTDHENRLNLIERR